MRRGFLVLFLLLGTVGGYAAGIARISGHGHSFREARERHWAEVCADAARRANTFPPAAPQPVPGASSPDAPDSP